MHLPDFQYLAPKDPAELAAMLAEHGDAARILSGGTDLLVQMKSPGLRPDYLIDITGLEELSNIKFDDGAGLVIGGAAKLEAVMDTPVVKEKYHGLWQSIETIGARQIRTMGSLGGNLCNASPAADTPPALVAFGAEVTIGNAEGDRSILLEDFILGNRQTALATGEYLKTITLPAPPENSASAYHHFRVRGGMEIAMAAVAVYLELDAKAQTISDAKIVLGVVGPAPIRATGAEQMLIGQKPDEALLQKAAQSCADQSRPIDDYRASAEYRREILKVLFERAFDDAFTNAAR
ncbi:MAG: xanthine dehydrogenase family protein subunit M [Rhodospirillaceae bacterium]|jgi:aerobic carbon-monoxide dehydrogenase medium subunit|nr:xanthine dehydrogenase family protein subunit M [Rhodospirillaceae bacterium]MBT3885537.1 xanthine dehydrogenase family protein subunit M [Rhodospirillaceae bacterium]MBT4117930.1 xanthine dehydrogenase family protein subunit M [Rhodospirillaceae bacterium]MBT4671596.1 xanthine dehydrogenase family protein subunit M [Rhodospirillaceae bacterium]MBT4718901.1 xanthine dehydrogenase family protein subunit M [Rhodospirillaceae bacterium]